MEDIIQSVRNYLSSDTGLWGYYMIIAVKILFILLISKLFISLMSRVIVKFFKVYPKLKGDPKKCGTLAGILKSIVRYAVYIVMGISILNLLNIPTQPLLATAGLGGIAIGFGAQSLIKDIFTGFFILLEDQFGVGDYITLGGMTGTVEDMTLRTTRIRSYNGDLHIVPNGEIKTVTNHSRGNSLAIIDIGVAYETDQEKAITLIRETVEKYYDSSRELMADRPEVLGIVKFSEAEVVIRSVIAARPLMHWRVEREVRRLLLEVLKSNNIEIPYPRRVILNNRREG